MDAAFSEDHDEGTSPQAKGDALNEVEEGEEQEVFFVIIHIYNGEMGQTTSVRDCL